MYLSLSCARAIADVAALARDRPSMLRASPIQAPGFRAPRCVSAGGNCGTPASGIIRTNIKLPRDSIYNDGATSHLFGTTTRQVTQVRGWERQRVTRVWAKCRLATAPQPSHCSVSCRASGWLASIEPRRNPTSAPASSPPRYTLHPCTERRQQVQGSRPCWASPTCRGGSSACRREPPSRLAAACSS